MHNRLFIIPFLLFSLTLHAQSINRFQEARFAFKVKQVDEFFQRFNHSPYSLAVQQNPGMTHREDLLSLFDQDRETWDYEMIEQFVGEVEASSGRKTIDFYDPDWYAELRCSFLYHGKPRIFTLILQNQLTKNGGSKWVIVSILESLDEIFFADIPPARNPGLYLHPMSHASNFIGLEQAFEDRENLYVLFDPWNQGMDFLAFKHGLYNGAAVFQSIQNITYHFIQLDNWILTLDYFPRQELNSGWLISDLSAASAADKNRDNAKKLNLI